MNDLPDKPSELIRVALRDLRRVEDNPNYKIDMMVWHCPDGNDGVCRVCLAGAVMAGLGAPPDESLSPYGYPARTVQALCSLNRFRQGRIHHALNALHIQPDDHTPSDRPVTPYETSPEDFQIELANIAKELAKVGL